MSIFAVITQTLVKKKSEGEVPVLQGITPQVLFDEKSSGGGEMKV